jgi:hypothetical protein
MNKKPTNAAIPAFAFIVMAFGNVYIRGTAMSIPDAKHIKKILADSVHFCLLCTAIMPIALITAELIANIEIQSKGLYEFIPVTP